MANNLLDMLTMAPHERMQQAGFAQDASNAAAYRGLLDQYQYQNPPAGTLGDDGLSMPPQSGFVGQGGLVTGGPPPDFYLRAAGIPGYQNLVQQAQEGQQAMERQMQGQQWSMSNMPLADKTRLDMLQSQNTWEQGRREFEWNNPSAYQQFGMKQDAARTGIAAGGLSLQQQEFNAKYPVNPVTGQREPRPEGIKLPTNMEIGVDGVTPVPMRGTPEYSKAVDSVTASNSLIQDLQSYRNMATNGVSFAGPGARKAEALRSQLVTKVAKSIAGEGLATTKQDMERAEELVPDITSVFGRDKAKLEALDNMVSTASRAGAASREKYKAYRGLPPSYQPLKAPPGFK